MTDKTQATIPLPEIKPRETEKDDGLTVDQMKDIIRKDFHRPKKSKIRMTHICGVYFRVNIYEPVVLDSDCVVSNDEITISKFVKIEQTPDGPVIIDESAKDNKVSNSGNVFR